MQAIGSPLLLEMRYNSFLRVQDGDCVSTSSDETRGVGTWLYNALPSPVAPIAACSQTPSMRLVGVVGQAMLASNNAGTCQKSRSTCGVRFLPRPAGGCGVFKLTKLKGRWRATMGATCHRGSLRTLCDCTTQSMRYRIVRQLSDMAAPRAGDEIPLVCTHHGTRCVSFVRLKRAPSPTSPTLSPSTDIGGSYAGA